jgi:hypothetical protein
MTRIQSSEKGVSASNLGRWRELRRLGRVFLLRPGTTGTEDREAHGRRRWRAPSPLYAASFYNLRATTQSRRWEVSVLTTYHSGNGPQTTGDGKVARPVLEDDGGSFRCSFGSGDGPNDGGIEGGLLQAAD